MNNATQITDAERDCSGAGSRRARRRTDISRAASAAHFDAAVAARAGAVRSAHLPRGRPGPLCDRRGQGAAAMARAVEDHWRGRLTGLVVTRYGHAAPCERIEVVEAAHPVPDAAGRRAAHASCDWSRGLSRRRSGALPDLGRRLGAARSAAAGLTLDDKQAVNRALLESGAAIDEMNCVRKHLSAIKGGRLAAACHRAVVTLLISDVPGDVRGHRLGPDRAPTRRLAPTRCDLALRHRDRAACRETAGSGGGETPKPGDPRLAGRDAHDRHAADGARSGRRGGRRAGIAPYILGDAIEGEAREVGKVMAGIALAGGAPRPAVCGALVLLSGGETTYRARQRTRRAQRRVPAVARDRSGRRAGHVRAGRRHRRRRWRGGDRGRDRYAGHPGARAGPRAWAARQPCRQRRPRFLRGVGRSVVTGPTLTNVNDFRAILIDPPAGA